MQYQNNSPIYLQIIDDFKQKIINGEYQSGDKVLPVRECAIAYAVNPNTMQKALTLLEQEGLLYTKRTAGRYICDDENRIAKLKEEMIAKQIKQMITKIRSYGIHDDLILEMVKGELNNEID